MTGSEMRPVTFTGDFSKKLVANTFFNLLGRSWTFIVTLLLTPFILSHLSSAEFGNWILLSVLINAFNLLDAGLGSSFVKFISEYHTFNDQRRINQVLFNGLIFYTGLGLAIILLGLALERPLFALLNLSVTPHVYYMVLAACALSNIVAMLMSVFRGIQRMDQSNTIEIVLGVLYAGGTVLFLQAGWGVYGLAVNTLLNVAAGFLLSLFTLRRVMPHLVPARHFDVSLMRKLFGYGARIQVSRIGGLMCFQVDKLIVSIFLGPASVSFYEVSSRLASFMRAIPLIMLSAVIPATSELGAREDRQKILQTYSLASKYVAMITFALAGFLIAEAGAVLFLWLGPGFDDSVAVMQILTAGYAVNILGGAASQTGAGIGRPEFDMRATILLLVLNPVLSIVLLRELGMAGAAAGTAIAMIGSACYLLAVFHRNYVSEPAWSVIRSVWLRPAIAAGVAGLAVVGLHQIFPESALWGTRSRVALRLSMGLSVFVPVYMILLIALRQLTATDRKNFASLVSFGTAFVRHPFRERVKIYR